MTDWDGPPRRLPTVLGVPQVMERYGLRDPRAARAVMRAAGAFTAGRRLLVRVDALDEWERSQATPVVPRPRTRARAARRRHATRRADTSALQPGWWRTSE